MKRMLVCLAAGLCLLVFMAGCGKQPTQELSDAKAAIDATVSDGAEKYAKEELQRLNDSLSTAMDEISVQDKKFFKNYDMAKEKLAEVKADAESLQMELPAKKEEAKNNALSAQGDARNAVEEAKILLNKAPKGKGSRADIEAMKADVAGLETELNEVQNLINSEEYFAASEKARAIKEKAAEVSTQIADAMQKVSKKK